MSEKQKIHFSKSFSEDSQGTPASLILIDHRAKIFLLLMLGLYIIMSMGKLHTSSIGAWDLVFGKSNSESVIAGLPKGIRQDEWMVRTPMMIGQVNSGFPISSETLGDGNVPAFLGLPIKDSSMLLRPHYWSYFIFDIERAFAFEWNFNIFILIISTFLLFMLLTGSNFWLSIFGSFLLFLSGAMQWWSYWMGSEMVWANGAVLSMVYLLFSTSKTGIGVSGLVLLLSLYNFVVGLYPPWLVPFVYLYFAVFVGFFIAIKDKKVIFEKTGFRLLIFSVTVATLVFFLFRHYGLIKNTIELMMNTAYPGERSTNGGDLVEGKLFSEFFCMFMSEGSFPRKWWNISEASGYMMFFPIVFFSAGLRYYRSRKIDWQILLLALYILVILIWLLVGFPAFLSKGSLLSMSPVYRTLPVLGVANIFLLISWLGTKSRSNDNSFSGKEFGIVAVGVLVFFALVSKNINAATEGFFTPIQVTTVLISMSLVYLLVHYKDVRYAKLILGLLLLGINIPNIRIHPLTKGLSPVLNNPLVLTVKKIQKSEPASRWAVFGDQRMSNLLRSTGINVFNGVKNVPLLNDLKILDPTGKDYFIYNRYAHINLISYIDTKDTVLFKLNTNEVVNDNYSIVLDPCSPRLEQLGIDYFLFTYLPSAAEVRCMFSVNANIYKRKT